MNRRTRSRKLVPIVDLRTYAVMRLEIGWSLEQMAGRMQCDGQPLPDNHETIYAYVCRIVPQQRPQHTALDEPADESNRTPAPDSV